MHECPSAGDELKALARGAAAAAFVDGAERAWLDACVEQQLLRMEGYMAAT